jgi:tetratricopeptide (TPR) repeat protein
VPAGRAVKVKGPQATQTVTSVGGFQLYSWTYSQLQRPKESANDQKKATEVAQGRQPPPDVQISSFQSWEEVGVQTASSSAPMLPMPPLPAPLTSFLPGIQELPESRSADANRLEADARSALNLHDGWAAISAFKSVLEADPKFTRAWLELAATYLALRQSDSALEAFRKAIDSDPKKVLAHKAYAFALASLHRPEAAMDAWRETLQIAPDDPDANSGMGLSLVQQKRYSEALPYLEAAAKTDHSTVAQFRLGSAYLRAGQIEKGTATLGTLLESDPKAGLLNDVAYELADTNASLPKALEYAQQAVEKQEKESFDVELSNLLPDDLACTQKIGNAWDTLGCVHFRLDHFDQAESYLQAAWLLSQLSVVADHLGQLYEQEKKTEQAIHMYRLALVAPELYGGSWDQTRHRLEHLTGTKAPATPGASCVGFIACHDSSGGELSQLRSAKLKRLVPGSATAEFFLLFSPGPKLEDVQFISGSEKLKSAGDALSEAHFQITFPKGSSARLVRRAILACSGLTGCEAVLLTPDSVNSVK